MELFIQLIFSIAILKYCLKAASFSSFKIVFIYAALAAIFSLAMYPVIINMPSNIIEKLLANREIVTDGAVLSTIEAIGGVFISILLLDNYFAPREKRNRAFFALKGIPGLIAFVAMAYFQLLFFMNNVGVDFVISAAIYAALIFVSISIIAIFMYKNIPHESVRLELKILLNLAILVIGLLVNSSIADYNLSNAHSSLEWGALLAILSLCIFMFFAGILLDKFNIKNRLINSLKQSTKINK